MASESTLTPTGYIGHHLTNLTASAGQGSFWTIHVDTVITAAVLGVLGIGFLWWVVRSATAGVPGKRQAFVELAIEFVWVLLMNAMDFLPVDWVVTLFFERLLGLHAWRPVPTADVNTTFALSLSVWVLMIFFSFKVKGVGGFMHELFCSPFGVKPLWLSPLLLLFNLLFNLAEYISKPLSHSLRLFGNMYAGEIIFLLLGLWAATGVVGTVFGAILGVGWAIFHILIVGLQAYIFMMLTVVYIAMAHESH